MALGARSAEGFHPNEFMEYHYYGLKREAAVDVIPPEMTQPELNLGAVVIAERSPWEALTLGLKPGETCQLRFETGEVAAVTMNRFGRYALEVSGEDGTTSSLNRESFSTNPDIHGNSYYFPMYQSDNWNQAVTASNGAA